MYFIIHLNFTKITIFKNHYYYIHFHHLEKTNLFQTAEVSNLNYYQVHHLFIIYFEHILNNYCCYY